MTLTFAGCQSAPQPEQKTDVAADTTAINALRDKVTAAFNSNDAAALAADYADDAIMMNPNQAAVEGKPAIQAAYEAMFKENAGKIAVTLVNTPLETQLAGDWAYDRGSATSTITPKTGKPVEQSGKYLVILKRQTDGSWKIYREISNMNNPPAGVAGKKK
ncbi:MAG: SgcJ/EcaC family oxidoreductase [Acidobacteria bacterium]|nr:SgcJ/EcaC family oxidoreductase [Acidobacteriota bacterium]